MDKLELKIDDFVEMWNGSRGNVTKLKFPILEIEYQGTKEEIHRVNIKKVNDLLIDGRDVIFEYND